MNTKYLDRIRGLSDKDLTIFNAEMQRRQKNVLVAYVLWFFLGWAGAHKFYMQKNGFGALYLLLTVFGYMSMFGGVGVALADPAAGEAAGGAMALGMLALCLWGLFMLWDLIFMTSQLNKREDRIAENILRDLSRPQPTAVAATDEEKPM